MLAFGTPIPLKDPDTLLSVYRYYVFVITIMAAQNNLRRFLHARITLLYYQVSWPYYRMK